MSLLPEIQTPEDYAACFQARDRWAPALSVIAARHHLSGPILPASAGVNLVFSVGDAFIKLCCPLWAAEGRVEREMLRALRLPVATPPIRAEGELEGWSYLVVGRLPGVHAEDVLPILGDAARVRLCAQVGEVIAALRATPPPPSLPAVGTDFFDVLHAEAPARWGAWGWPTDAVTPLLARPDGGGAPCTLHADLTDDNVLVAEVNGEWQVSGVLDFADAMIGPPAYELVSPAVYLCRGHLPSLRAMLRAAGWDADDPDVRRALVEWTVLHRFIGFAPDGRSLPARLAALWGDRG